MGSTVKRFAGRGVGTNCCSRATGIVGLRPEVGRWLKELGIFGQRSHEKRLPCGVFELADEQILCTLLRHLWATDGSISVRKNGSGAPRVFFATCSSGLAGDVAALPLRLGIVGPSAPRSRRSTAPSIASMSRGSSIVALLDTVGAFGPRVAPAAALRCWLDAREPNTNVDTLPLEAFAEVRASMRSHGVTTPACPRCAARPTAALRISGLPAVAHHDRRLCR